MKPRGSTVITAVGYLAVCGVFAYEGPRFGKIFNDLFEGSPTLPLLTRAVLALAPYGWILIGISAAALLVAKDLCPSTRKIPSWPFFFLLVALGFAGLAALFMPLLITISKLAGPS